MWAQRVEAQRTQKGALDEMKNLRDFNHIYGGKRAEIDNEQHSKEQYKKQNHIRALYHTSSG